MKLKILVLCLLLAIFAHKAHGYSYTGNYCCNSSNTSFNTTTCASSGSDSSVGSISCTVTVAANQTVFVFGYYGIAFTPTPIVTSNCGIVWQPGGRGSAGINGIATYPFASIGDTGGFSGSCTISMAPTGGPDFMYIHALVYDLGVSPALQDPAGVLVGGALSPYPGTTTDTITYPPTSYSSEVFLCAHIWEGLTSAPATLSGGSGETVRFNNSQTFTILSTNKTGELIEDFQGGPPSLYNSIATSSDAPGTAGGSNWIQIMIPVRTAGSVGVQGEKKRRVIN